MTFQDQTLNVRIQTLDREIASIDLPALQAAHERAASAQEANRARLTKAIDLPIERAQQEWQGLCGAVKAASSRLEEEKARRARLVQQRAHVDQLLRHEEIAATARQHHAEATSRRHAAAAVLASAEETLATIKGLIVAEREAHAKATESAAARLLALVKAGTPPAQVEAASSDRIATMELSQTAAEAEVLQARQGLDRADAEVAKAAAQILVAEATGAELRYLSAQQAYTEALAVFAVAHYRAHRTPFVVPDLRAHAHQAMAKAGL